jgi:hypothetical protein
MLGVVMLNVAMLSVVAPADAIDVLFQGLAVGYGWLKMTRSLVCPPQAPKAPKAPQAPQAPEAPQGPQGPAPAPGP